ncbi:MAG TPA: hypothetical protein VGM69_08465 [Chloroflexota bacterium]|jgi:hypothetical protein
MPVVIDDFQVVTEPPSGDRAAANPANAPAAAAGPSPREVERAVERRIERLARVRAH